MTNTKIIYIAAHSRSGSTILDRILGQIDGGFTVGEIRNIWERSFLEDQLCGCKAKFSECPIWGDIVSHAGFDRDTARNMYELGRDVDRFKRLPQIVNPTLRSRLLDEKMHEFQSGLKCIYSSIKAIVNPKVIIDSSKTASYAMHLHSLDDFDIHVVHLVRDARAVAFSRLQSKKRPEIHWRNEFFAVTPVYKTSLQWNLINRSIEWLESLGSYSIVRYEDFATNPRAVVSKILKEILQEELDLSFMSDGKIKMGVDHTVSGNPIRFGTGDVELRNDDRWTRSLSEKDKNTVKVLSYMRLKKYGYLP
jgi:hypothetical protein